MSEEEIMQGINKTISFMKEELKADHSCFTIQELWAVNGLLDLYQEEKEKNKNLLQLLNKSGIDTINLVNDVNNNYISKDKIREKIKELENEIEIKSLYEENWNKIEVLKELLEENKSNENNI